MTATSDATLAPRPSLAVRGIAKRIAAVAALATVAALGAASTSEAHTSGNPLSKTGRPWFVNPDSPAARTVNAWSDDRPEDAAQVQKIAGQPQVEWVGGWNRDIYSYIRRRIWIHHQFDHALPMFALKNIPIIDRQGVWRGGARTHAAYRQWIRTVASAIGSEQAIIILEPDALPAKNTRSGSRFDDLKYAAITLSMRPNISVYIDAGSSSWNRAVDIARWLRYSGVHRARGFALNTTHMEWTSSEIRFGREIVRLLGYHRHFVVGTDRNGRGPRRARTHSEWLRLACNDFTRALGPRPTTRTADTNLADGYLWSLGPGRSDGTCNKGQPRAGAWFPEYGLALARNAAY